MAKVTKTAKPNAAKSTKSLKVSKLKSMGKKKLASLMIAAVFTISGVSYFGYNVWKANELKAKAAGYTRISASLGRVVSACVFNYNGYSYGLRAYFSKPSWNKQEGILRSAWDVKTNPNMWWGGSTKVQYLESNTLYTSVNSPVYFYWGNFESAGYLQTPSAITRC